MPHQLKPPTRPMPVVSLTPRHAERKAASAIARADKEGHRLLAAGLGSTRICGTSALSGASIVWCQSWIRHGLVLDPEARMRWLADDVPVTPGRAPSLLVSHGEALQ